jgi:hypothetical protein
MEDRQPHRSGGRILVAVLIGTIGSGLLFSAGLAVPIIGFASAFIAPVPLGFTRIRGGSAAAGFSAILTTLLLAVLFSPVIGAWYAVQCGLIGLIIPELALRNFGLFRSMLWTTAAAAGLTLVLFGIMTIAGNINPQLFIQKEISTSISQAAKLYEQQSGLTPQDLEVLQEGMQTVSRLLLQLYPALITINLGLISAVTMLLFRRLAAKAGTELQTSPFASFRAPALLIWPLIAAGFAMLVPTTLISTPAFNLVVLLAMIYFLQGLAVVFAFCERTTFASTLKMMLAIVLLTQPYLAGVAVIIGIFDFWGDFRTPRSKQDENL